VKKAAARIGYLVSHPIQYQAPLLRRIAQDPDIDLTVLYCSDISVREHNDHEFGTSFQWDIPLLDGYQYEFLPSLFGRGKLGFWSPFNYKIIESLRRNRFDVLWVHGWGYFSHIMAIVFSKFLGIRVLVRGETTLHIPVNNLAKKFIKDKLICLLFDKIDGFMAIGSLNREFYLHYGVQEERIFDMPYAVDNKFFQSQCADAHTRQAELRLDLGLDTDRPVILYASKLTSRKRIIDLLDAYIDLSGGEDLGRDPYLLIVGDGEMRPELERRVSELDGTSVRFLGFKNQTELPALFDLCDIFVLPSYHEPWGLVVNEAMNAGKLMIVSDQVGCAQDLVKDDYNGYIYEAGNIEALSKALRRALDSSSKTQSMGRMSKQIIDEWSFEEDVSGLRHALQYFGLIKE